MQTRLNNPSKILPDAMQGIQSLIAASQQGGVPPTTLELVHLRVSQINGCSACIEIGINLAKKSGSLDDRLWVVPGWRDSPRFNDAERAALALAEAATRLNDREDPVPDTVWDEAARHYDEKALAALVLWIATTNFFNRLNVTTKQQALDW